jgi:hypothetical protein
MQIPFVTFWSMFVTAYCSVLEPLSVACFVFGVAFFALKITNSTEMGDECGRGSRSIGEPRTQILTIEAIRRNPWNVLSHKLPHVPDRLLLRLALFAADYCRHSEWVLMYAALADEYIPPEFRDEQDAPDIHELSEGLANIANDKFKEICEVIDKSNE